MLLFEAHAQRTTFTYNVSPNGAGGDWYWEVTCGGHVVARGLATTQVEARADAICPRLSHRDRTISCSRHGYE
jgi:hypothetical protein